MLTRCPSCATRFRVNLEHLYAAAGQVRCGRCAQIFDAQRQAITLGPPTLPYYDPIAKSRPRRHSAIVWGFSIWLLLLALPIQYIWWERTRLVADPTVGPLLVKLCQQIPCGLPQFRDPKQIQVLERSLDPSPKHPGFMHFSLRMVNQAPRPQALPVLELRLLDAQTKVVGQRRFTPQQYQPTATPTDLMWPGEPVQAGLELLNPQDAVVGFQMEFR